MKQTNSTLLRLGYISNWESCSSVLNLQKHGFRLVQLSIFLFNWAQLLCFRYRRFLFFPIKVSVFLEADFFLLILKVFSIYRYFLYHLRFFVKSRFIFSRYCFVSSTIFYSRCLAKLENFFSFYYEVQTKIYFFNVARWLLMSNFLRFLYNHRRFYNRSFRLMNFAGLMAFSIYFADINLFGLLLSRELQRQRYHSVTFSILAPIISSFLLLSCRVKGILVQVSGRWNNRDRQAVKRFHFGQVIRRHSLGQPIKYLFRSVITPIGTFGLKIWMF